MKILKKTLGIFGFKLVDKNLIQNERIINSYSKIDINFFLQSIINFKKNLEIVQIGASDGITDDFLNKYIKSNNLKCLLVEPIRESFEVLKKNYQNCSNISFENSAIDSVDGKRNIFQVGKEFIKLYGSHIPYLTSFNKKHLTKHGVKRRHITKTEIDVLSPITLLNKYNIKSFDLLVVDTEGFDNVIVENFLKLDIKKLIIIFEWIHIDKKKLEDLCDKFSKRNYKLFKVEKDVLCIPNDVKLQLRISEQ